MEENYVQKRGSKKLITLLSMLVVVFGLFAALSFMGIFNIDSFKKQETKTIDVTTKTEEKKEETTETSKYIGFYIGEVEVKTPSGNATRRVRLALYKNNKAVYSDVYTSFYNSEVLMGTYEEKDNSIIFKPTFVVSAQYSGVKEIEFKIENDSLTFKDERSTISLSKSDDAYTPKDDEQMSLYSITGPVE